MDGKREEKGKTEAEREGERERGKRRKGRAEERDLLSFITYLVVINRPESVKL